MIRALAIIATSCAGEIQHKVPSVPTGDFQAPVVNSELVVSSIQGEA